MDLVNTHRPGTPPEMIMYFLTSLQVVMFVIPRGIILARLDL